MTTETWMMQPGTWTTAQLNAHVVCLLARDGSLSTRSIQEGTPHASPRRVRATIQRLRDHALVACVNDAPSMRNAEWCLSGDGVLLGVNLSLWLATPTLRLHPPATQKQIEARRRNWALKLAAGAKSALASIRCPADHGSRGGPAYMASPPVAGALDGARVALKHLEDVLRAPPDAAVYPDPPLKIRISGMRERRAQLKRHPEYPRAEVAAKALLKMLIPNFEEVDPDGYASDLDIYASQILQDDAGPRAGISGEIAQWTAALEAWDAYQEDPKA